MAKQRVYLGQGIFLERDGDAVTVSIMGVKGPTKTVASRRKVDMVRAFSEELAPYSDVVRGQSGFIVIAPEAVPTFAEAVRAKLDNHEKRISALEERRRRRRAPTAV